ncbi:MAG: DUF3788 domain-containing protein [Acidobacteria bacterium]|nr:MAG: DUF3788 domain-containing protein [Acidobacteriota bacterium]
MQPNAFIGKAEQPTEAELSEVLGSARVLWDRLVSNLSEKHEVSVQEWNSYSRKAGWALKLKRKDRAIVYLSPAIDCFMASFALGDRAVEAARQTDFPEEVIQTINQARRYAEGTAVRIDVRTPEDVDVIEKLAVIKLEH